MSGALSGIRILDFGRFIAGPFCATLLADLGAEVIRIEQPSGGEDRYINPISDTGEGTSFLQISRNKLGITLNLGSIEAREIIERLVKTADVVVVNMPTPTLKKIGLDYDSLKALKENIILTTTTAFGPGGPSSDKVGFDGIAQAMSGAMYMSGEPDTPTKSIANFVDYGTASLSALATVAALYELKNSGKGQHVQTSLLNTSLTYLNGLIMEQDQTDINRVSSGNRAQTTAPGDCFQTKDGWIMVQVVGQPLFKRWANLMQESQWLTDPRFGSDKRRGENSMLISDRMATWCSELTTRQAIEQLEMAKIPVGEVLSPQGALENDHIKESNQFHPVDFPGLSKPALVSTPPFKLTETPARIPKRGPILGEHNDSVLLELGFTTQQVEDFRRKGVI